jgi:hypothetical protein
MSHLRSCVHTGTRVAAFRRWQGDRPDRDGKRLLANHIDEETHRAFKSLAAKQGTTSVALMYEAVALVLAAHGERLPTTTQTYLSANGRPTPGATFRNMKASILG